MWQLVSNLLVIISKRKLFVFMMLPLRFAQERKKLNDNSVSTLLIYRAFLVGLGVFNSNEVKLVFPISVFLRGEKKIKKSWDYD